MLLTGENQRAGPRRFASRWPARRLIAPCVSGLLLMVLTLVPIGGSVAGAATGTVPTSTAVTTSIASSVIGQPVTLTATVTIAPPAVGVPPAGVVFYDGSTVLGAVAPVNGQANLTTASLLVGTHNLSAYYVGDPVLAASTSTVVPFTVAQASTAVSLSPSVASSLAGQSVTFTATLGVVAPGSGSPGAPISILDGATPLANLVPAGGKVTFTTYALAVGTHSLSASFAGGSYYLPSTSPVLSFTVDKAATTTALTASTTTPRSGQTITFTAAVSVLAPGAGTAGSPVTFMDGATTLATVAPVGGTARFTTAMITAGSHDFSATSTGGPSYLPSTSPTLTLGVVSCGCDWTQFRDGPNHYGANPAESALSKDTVEGLTQKWAIITGAPIRSSPAVVNGIVYVGSNDGRIFATNAATGAVVWTVTTGGLVHASPAVANGVVYIGSDDGTFRALDALTGAVKWTIVNGTPIDAPATVWNGVVYFGATDSKVYAVNAVTGAIIWSAATGGKVHDSPAVGTGMGNLYVGADDGKIYAFNLATGAQVWTWQTGGAIAASPTIISGAVYAPSDDGRLYVLRGDTGAPLWWQNTGSIVESSPAVVNGVVYVGNNAGTCFAFNAATGAIIWTAATGGEIHSSPAVANGVVYIGSMDHSLYAYDATTGATLWTYTTGYPITSSPTVVNGWLYVGGWDYVLHAFTVPAGAIPTAPHALHVA